MASESGLPERPVPTTTRESSDGSETEPLLARPGDAGLFGRANIVRETFIGIGIIIPEIGVLMLCCSVWAQIASHPINFFSGHPTAMSIAIFILTQSTLFQQRFAADDLGWKLRGQHVHASLNLVAFMALVTGFTIVEVTKARLNESHPPSTHTVFGLSTLVLLLVQYLFGVTMWMTPSLYGGEARARALYKYHRFGGYFILVMILATAVTATLTGYNKYVLRINVWVVSGGAFLIAIGVFSTLR